ncbi:hypothetical protein HII28_19540 [Planctomonas sp. JC2975]|uniref:hypothetical protein n=1 Tax=Planctomonas sp. JC2975 TaxID=2729626 RepID=UPI001473D73F|nr:hypothetical protein [Planctomonas sp. JC2975]NNC14057.1 hypothetical protein [Planctomonas sp. JC2975]
MSDAPRPVRTRPRWPWIVVGLAALLVALVLILALTGGFSSTSNAQPTARPTSSQSPTATDAPGVAANGCIGGNGRDAAMLIAAQKAAPHTTNGAASMAAAFMRWLYQFPNPSTGDVQQVTQSIVSSKDDPEQFAQFVTSDTNRSGGLVPDGQPFSVSTVPGVFYVESTSTADQPVISVGAGLVTDGALSATLRESTTVTLRWEDGAWKVLGAKGTRTTQSLFSIGTAYSGGC